MTSNLLPSLAAAALLAAAPTAMAHSLRCVPGPYGVYQDPDGTYPSMAALVRDLRGIPCGVNCTRAAEARWAKWAQTHC